mgnify:FL=1
MPNLEDRIARIEARNHKVTIDKKWETSWTRRLFISLITYIFAGVIFIWVIPNREWYLAAIVPVTGYILSTLGLPWVRKIWQKYLNI